jgi:NAD(P)-dependent dehydrogenase (short-subunit alcohol dehydrogenase family)
MDLDAKHVVVTGAGRGIGEALARRFHSAGAVVTLADLAAADDVAESLGDRATGVVADLSTEAGNVALIETATSVAGPIDLFFANAGVATGTDLASTDEATWETAFAINVHAHRWAAKQLVPGWLERGDGYFCSTASAAGLLAQIGSAPYTLTKRAAVAFAEWLAITYGDRGIKVSCLCPQGVNTAMLNQTDAGSGGADVVRTAGAVLEPDVVADIVHDAVVAEQFLILPHPEVHRYMQNKAADPDRWLAGMRRLQAHVIALTEQRG